MCLSCLPTQKSSSSAVASPAVQPRITFAKLGKRDVLLLEQGKLTCGTTWQRAGLIGQMRPNRNMTQMSKYGIALYSTLEARSETGLATGWKSMQQRQRRSHAGTTEGTQKQIALAKKLRWREGARNLAGRSVREQVPVMRTDDPTGAIWIPGDGKANPADLANVAHSPRCACRLRCTHC